VTVERVNPPELAPPVGYSHATVASGRIIFLAGQTALTPTGELVPGTVVEQFERALGNLLTALAAAGGASEQLASLTIYATDIPDYRAHAGEIGAVWRRLAGRTYPAMALIGVERLWDEGAVVEIQGFAVVEELT
jgi:enamine deaminase RidA (YjgF/YER057c/UK114 family)